MRPTNRPPADSPWERAKMEQMVRADIAAFGAGRAEMANAMIEDSGLRMGADYSWSRGARRLVKDRLLEKRAAQQ